MTKATDTTMGKLHGKVAEAMINAIDQADCAVGLLAKERDGVLPDDVIDFLEELTEVSPSLLTAAAKFLKDNHITSDVEQDDAMDDLKTKLAGKRKASVTRLAFED